MVTSTVVPASYSTSISSNAGTRSEEHTSELQSRLHLVCRLLLEKKKYISDISRRGQCITFDPQPASPHSRRARVVPPAHPPRARPPPPRATTHRRTAEPVTLRAS